jgi:hypothetical protein
VPHRMTEEDHVEDPGDLQGLPAGRGKVSAKQGAK